MMPITCFESFTFVPFTAEKNLINNGHGPYVNFYNDVFIIDTQYLVPVRFQRNFVNSFVEISFLRTVKT